MIPQLKLYLIKHWPEIFPHIRLPRSIDFLQVSGSISAPGKVFFLAFIDGKPKPQFVVKVSRNQRDNSFLVAEYENLKYVHKITDEFAKESVPRAVLLEDIGEHKILIQTAVVGESLKRRLRAGPFINKGIILRVDELLTDWLANFQLKIGLKEEKLDSQFLEAYIRKPIETFVLTFDLSEIEKQYFQSFDEIWNKLSGIQLPLVFQHGDFMFSNIFNLRRDKLGIIDWENARKAQLPMHDLFHCLLWQGFLFFKAKTEYERALANFQFSFCEDNWYSKIIKSCFKKYCSKIGIDEKLMEVLFVMFLVNSANKEYADLMRDADRGFIGIDKGMSGGLGDSYLSLLRDRLYINLFRIFIEKKEGFLEWLIR